MRHKVKSTRLGRTTAHRRATAAALVRGLINEQRIKTTLQKARLTRVQAEKIVTVARKGTLASRRQVVAFLSDGPHVKKLFEEIVPLCKGRNGGYTRIIKLGRRVSDSSEMVLLEWVRSSPADAAVTAGDGAEAGAEKA
ncbi:MAG: 50S ribosomal protein L17 [Lentisphaerae bacterium]|nr:50S ribosomal protein L17 [Lentisphaerota bacterium]